MTCTAHRSNGQPCKGQAITGANVCRVHGGWAPQVRAKARQRILELACGPAVATLAHAVQRKRNTKEPPTAQEISAAKELIRMAGLDYAEYGQAEGGSVKITEQRGGTVHEFLMVYERRLREEASDAS